MYSSSLLQLSSVVNATGLAAQFKSIVPSDLFLALGLGFVIGLIIAIVYRKTYRGVLYSPSFALTLIMLTLITTPVVMCIKSDIALSMGMVGALSIVRFRAAVKDPLDIGFLFWGIAAGITAGAQLYWVALLGTAIIAVLYIIITICRKEKKSYLLIIRYNASSEMNVTGILNGVKYRLKNKTQTGDHVELTIEVKIKKNDTTYLSRFNAVEGVESVTLLEYSGEYLN